MLTPLGENFWIGVDSVRLLGVKFDRKMAAIRLESGGCVLIGPNRPGEWEREIEALGGVQSILVPGMFHTDGAREAFERFPNARQYVCQGLAKAFPSAVELRDEAPAEWRPAIEIVFIDSSPRTYELAVFHTVSRTLLIVDFTFHFGEQRSRLANLLLDVNRIRGRMTTSRLYRSFLKNPAAFRASVEQVRALPFERIVFCHGEPILTNAREAFDASFAWLTT